MTSSNISDEELLEILREYVKPGTKEGTPEGKAHHDNWERVRSLILEDPEPVWRMIELACEASLSDQELAYLAADAFEDLMRERGSQFIDRVEVAWRRNKRMRFAVAGVWTSSIKPPEVKARLDALKEKGGIIV